MNSLTIAERIELIEELWDCLTQEERDTIPLTREQQAEPRQAF